MPDDARHLTVEGIEGEIENRLATDASTGGRTIAMAAGGAGLGSVFGPEGAIAGAILGAVAILGLSVAHAVSRHIGQ